MRRPRFPDDFGDEQLVARRDESFARAERYREEIAMHPDPPEHIMQFFEYEHLPAKLAAVSKPFCELARAIVGAPGSGVFALAVQQLPRNPERTVALRKLLEAKDAAVRATLAREPTLEDAP